MNKESAAATLKKLRELSPKRNFKQSIDLIINLKGIDLKKTEHNVNMFVALPHDTGKKISVCALVDSDMESKAKDVCNEVILQNQFVQFKNKSEIKALANKHDFFIAQASLMPKVAAVFGRFLGPRGKMPNPKIGSVLPPNANIKALHEKLKKTISVATKNEPTIKCRIGNEDMPEDNLIDNALAAYNSVLPKLPNEKHNVKSVMLKLTMGPAFAVGKEQEKEGAKKGKKSEVKIKSGEKEEKNPGQEKKAEQAKKEKPEEKARQTKQKEKIPKENKKQPK
ncbi:50S ribosomal protein L1 [Candidatus Woesearchaeota archaeon]|nr:50S ribosomal protein L1 [Candidatus Woesearchaeota archaeon]